MIFCHNKLVFNPILINNEFDCLLKHVIAESFEPRALVTRPMKSYNAHRAFLINIMAFRKTTYAFNSSTSILNTIYKLIIDLFCLSQSPISKVNIFVTKLEIILLFPQQHFWNHDILGHRSLTQGDRAAVFREINWLRAKVKSDWKFVAIGRQFHYLKPCKRAPDQGHSRSSGSNAHWDRCSGHSWSSRWSPDGST